MRALIAVLLAASTSGWSYELSEHECQALAFVAGKVAWQREHGAAVESIIGSIEAHKHTYPNEVIYDLVHQLTREIYANPALTPDEQYTKTLGECVRTDGKMDSRT